MVTRSAGLEAWAKKEDREADWWPSPRFEADFRKKLFGNPDDDDDDPVTFDPADGPVSTEIVSMAEFAARMRARKAQQESEKSE
jgi:hypothetical protein